MTQKYTIVFHWYYFQILELEPGIAQLGATFDEAAALQSGHLEVLKSLQSKQSPVEDLLKQADLVVAVKKGQFVYYSLSTSVLEDVISWLMSFKS